MAGAIERLLESLRAPEPEFRPHPFWFWNDDLDEGELLRQLHAFWDGGAGGVVIHPRIGLSRRVGYLTGEYFRLVERVVQECARLGMRVVLYDECSYPSGSACGRVVAENPGYAARALALARKAILGPAVEYWRPRLGRSLADRLVCVAVARLESEEGKEPRVDPASLRLLEPDERGLVRVAVGEGRWLAMACIDTPSGGRIRGAFAEQDDGMALAPAAGDLMNPEAVAAFIRVTHDAYYERLKEYFGNTIVALFTDEPSPMGRGAKRDVRPYTGGFDSWFEQYLRREHGELAAQLSGGVRAWLPALWVDYGPLTAELREAYREAVHRRIIDVFYRAQAEWCRAHGIALTGHPGESNDMASLAAFDWPGQDMVWRWVAPGGASGTEGEDSVAAKAATSGARAYGKRRIVTELYGAYGWRLTLDEVKWLADWHLVRGNNLFVPHAYYYSVRGGRAYESEPDLFLHNAWRPYLPLINRYIARICKLLTDCEHVCDVAVLGRGRALPWRAARSLYAAQIDFLYIDEASLGDARVDAERRALWVGGQAYRAVIVDGNPVLPERAVRNLDAFRAAGGLVVELGEGEAGEHGARGPARGRPGSGTPGQSPQRARQDAWLDAVRAASAAVARPLRPIPDLRLVHVRKGGVDAFLLTNEGEAAIRGALELALSGRAVWYDPLRDAVEEASVAAVPAVVESEAPVERAKAAPGGGRFRVSFELERRESRLLLVDPKGAVEPAREAGRAQAAHLSHGGRKALQGARPPASRSAARIDVPGPWRLTAPDGTPVDAPAPGDWTGVQALERFSGTLRYRAEVELEAPPAGVVVDLGAVGEIAEIYVNGAPAAICMWAPYRARTEGDLWRAGTNLLDVHVTNSSANAYEGAMRPSGLIGPVTLHVEDR